ncbi:putative RNA-directed DNA polymerase [Tanacetum coccineum]|uniref:RNA-directed DNA polymerase n=1 Tax=Tanacetum coccineum TaxID=301880 RepID=A0ABQ5AIT7_9ASTR
MKKNEKRELLKNQIKILEGDISASRRSFDFNIHEKANADVVEEMESSGSSRNQDFDVVYDRAHKEETDRIHNLTDEMLEFYEDSLAENVQDRNGYNKRIKVDGSMEDEVGEDLSAHASFMTQNEVSNTVDATMANMIVAWNIRGMTDTSKQDEIKLLMSENSLSMCAIVETRLNKKLVSKACNNIFGRWNRVSNVMDASRNCRIIVGWDPDMVDAILLSSHGQVMHFEVSLILDKRKFFISFIYGENDPKDRICLWENLIDHMGVVDGKPWVMMGDFNAILYFEDHSKGFANIYQGIREFRSCVHQLDMEDLCRNGLFYTWVQKSKDPKSGIMKKLNRVMGNNEFIDMFGACYANFLPYVTFDHCPALLVIPCSVAKRKRSFRFMNYITNKKEFHQVVKDNWNDPVHDFAMFVFAKRLKNMKRHIRDLNKRNGNVYEKVKQLREELKKVQSELDKDPHNIELKEAEMVFNHAYRVVVMDEEKVLKQKTKIEWLKEGDHNSAYFHNFLKGRLNRSRIISIEDDVGVVYHDEDVAPKFVDHFQTFLGTCDETFPIEDPDGLFIKKIDAVRALHMVKDVTNEEIKSALFDINDNKAPGPNGFTSRFFKASWEIIGKDFCAVVKEFFTSGKMLGELNTTLISLGVLNEIIDPNQSAFIEGRHISDNIMLAQELMFGYLGKMKGARCAFKVDIQKAYDTLLSLFALMGSLMGFLKPRGVLDRETLFLLISLQLLWKYLPLCLKGRYVSASVLRRALDEFCLSSGLRPNMAKSSVYFGNVPETVKTDIMTAMPFREGSFPIRYLGIPLDANRIVRNDCTVLLDKASMFILPQGVCDEIDKIFKEFLWKSDGKRKIRYSVAWKEVCLQKSEGGLGLKSIHVWNEALMAKHLWNVVITKDSIWVKWVRSHYLNDHTVWAVDPSHHSSWVWKQIMALRNKIRRFMKNWPVDWNTRFKEIRDIPIPNLFENNEDMVVWINKKGKEKNFCVKEVWKVLKANLPKVIWYDHVWFSQCVPRHSFILWMAIKGRLKTQDRISRWMNVQDMRCPFCKLCKDSYSHLFFSCTIAKRLWERLKGMARLEHVSNSWPQIISSIVNMPAKNTIWSVIQRLVFSAAVYFIWQERNMRLFGEVGRSDEVIFKLVVENVRLRLMGLKLKVTNEVIKASEIWNLPIDKMYEYKGVLDDLMTDVLVTNDGTI